MFIALSLLHFAWGSLQEICVRLAIITFPTYSKNVSTEKELLLSNAMSTSFSLVIVKVVKSIFSCLTSEAWHGNWPMSQKCFEIHIWDSCVWLMCSLLVISTWRTAWKSSRFAMCKTKITAITEYVVRCVILPRARFWNVKCFSSLPHFKINPLPLYQEQNKLTAYKKQEFTTH